MALSPRHPYMFSCALDKQVKCWDLEYNKVQILSLIWQTGNLYAGLSSLRRMHPVTSWSPVPMPGLLLSPAWI